MKVLSWKSPRTQGITHPTPTIPIISIAVIGKIQFERNEQLSSFMLILLKNSRMIMSFCDL